MSEIFKMKLKKVERSPAPEQIWIVDRVLDESGDYFFCPDCGKRVDIKYVQYAPLNSSVDCFQKCTHCNTEFSVLF